MRETIFFLWQGVRGVLILALFHLVASLAIIAIASVASFFGSSARGLTIILGGFNSLPWIQLFYIIPLIILAFRNGNIGMIAGVLVSALCTAYFINSYGFVT